MALVEWVFAGDLTEKVAKAIFFVFMVGLVQKREGEVAAIAIAIVLELQVVKLKN